MRLSLFQQHKQKWSHCDRCTLQHSRSKVVFYRGKIPCDILFVGEAPWVSEDASGIPFDGQAGDLLNDIVKLAIPEDWDMNGRLMTLRCAYTNVVCCKPGTDEKGNISKPQQREILSCRPRLQEFIRIANPRLVVAVGDIADRYLPTLTEGTSRVTIIHPSAILRADQIQKPSMTKRAIVTLANAVQNVFQTVNI